jgi:DNA-binding CsgD family transcriptional regulator
MASIFSEVSRFIQYLNLNPTLIELHSKLLLDFLIPFKISRMSMFSVENNGNLNKLASNEASLDYFKSDKELKHIEHLSSIYGKQNIIKEFSQKPALFTPDKTTCCTPVTNGRIESGLIHSEFSQPITDEDSEIYIIFMGLTSFYLFPKLKTTQNSLHTTNHLINPLTPRQRQVVQGFIEGKTNHELSLELGFSISTIRHETMAIFKTLGASDRKEAAKIAQEQSLI